MKSSFIRKSNITIVATVLILGACDQAGVDPSQLLAPDDASTLTPEAASLSRGGNHGGSSWSGKKGPTVRSRRKDGREADLHVAVRRSSANKDKASVWVDPDDSFTVLEFAGHTLTIPGAAVEKKTKFIISEIDHFVDGEYVLAVSLKATAGRGKRAVAVGEAGFLAPVELCLAYGDTEGFTTDGEHDLVWFKNSGEEVDAVDGVVHGDQVCGLLDHFSLWGLAWP